MQQGKSSGLPFPLDKADIAKHRIRMALEMGVAPADIFQFFPIPQSGAVINWDIDFEPGQINLHTHAFYEILFVIQGQEVQYILDNKRYQLQRGDVVIIPPNMPHRPLFAREMTQPYERFALWFDAAYFEQNAALFPELRYAEEQCRQRGSWLLRSTQATYSGLYASFNSLWLEARNQHFGWQAVVATGAIGLLAYICRAYYNQGARAASTELRSLADRVFHYIDANLASDLSLAAVAAHFHVSESTISHQFQSQLGVSYYRCVIQRRLLAAKALLLEGAPPGEVWFPCGFGDYSSFYRLFKKEYGISPQQFRKLNGLVRAPLPR